LFAAVEACDAASSNIAPPYAAPRSGSGAPYDARMSATAPAPAALGGSGALISPGTAASGWPPAVLSVPSSLSVASSSSS
jgi:hypothetical protein